SLKVQRQLSSTTSALDKVYARLSSGVRINRASDDAAGLAIADALRTDVRLYSQALRNINDGISLLAIASGALSEMSGLITRIRELAEQSANGVYSSMQR